MTIKSILCLFGGTQDELSALNAAFSLGKAYGAMIRVLHISADPDVYTGLYGEGVLASVEIIEAIEKTNAQRLAQARQHVSIYAAKHQLPVDVESAQPSCPSVRFQHLTGKTDSIISHEGRLCDLIVVGRETTPAYDLTTPALFNTGRPVLLIPSAAKASDEFKNKTMAFAWDGSLQAARALYNALPLIARAQKFYILTIDKHAHDLEADASLIRYLRAHGIHAQGMLVGANNYVTKAEALLMRARDLHADVLVMGAYGHSMLREMILGGVTEHMLQKADISLLLSH